METSFAARDLAKPVEPDAAPHPDAARYRVDLPGGTWMLWRWAALRGAGFPADLLLELGTPDCARAADALNQEQQREADASQGAISVIQRAMGEAGRHRPAARKALQLLQAPEFAAVLQTREDVCDAVRRWRHSSAACSAAQERFDAQFGVATLQVTDALKRVAGRPDFREAVAWQNRHALHTGIDPLLLHEGVGEARGSKLRQREQLVANYLQRYCVKNDTIGFFGPVGWARLVSDGPALRVRTGSSLLARRNLYFESWCVDALVENFEHRGEVLPWIAPRRSCTMHETDGVAHLPFRAPVRLSPAERAALAACDGGQPAHRIAAALVADPDLGLRSAAEVYELLQSLQARGMLWWQFELPRQLRPELALRDALAGIEDPRLRAPLAAALDQLQAAFETVAAAAGDADAVSASTADLEATFNRLTGRAATRSAGETYAGRTLVYEDCIRDGELQIGPEVLADVGPALSLVLDSARWLGYAVWFSYRKIAASLYATLVRSMGSAQVDFVQFWARIQPFFFERREEVGAAALAQFQKRWARIVPSLRDARHLHFTADALRQAVTKEFSLDERPRSLSRYHCPDLMFAATDAEALRRLDYQAVLGELHAGINTLAWPLFIEQHPSPEDLFRAVELDLSEPRLLPIVPKGAFGDVTRLFPALASPKDYYLGLQAGPTQVDGSRYLPIGELIVEERGSELLLRTRDGRVTLDLMVGLGQFIDVVTAGRFKPFDIDGHLPRITIDRLVVCREAWSFAFDAADFAFRKEEAQRYAEARAWATRHDLPRFVFVKFPGEGKPVYIDFASPVYVEILSKLVRRAAAAGSQAQALFTVTEMLPEIEQSWLPGAAGERYTCELRMVAVDRSDHSC